MHLKKMKWFLKLQSQFGDHELKTTSLRALQKTTAQNRF